MPYAHLLNDFVRLCQEVCVDTLTGVYLHGSLAMGCFNPAKSDIDLLVIVHEPLDDRQKRRLMTGIVRLNDHAPAKGIEVSVLLASDCLPFQYPTPFLLHFSPMHLAWWQRDHADYAARMNGLDKDLAAHVRVLHQCGVVLCGRPIAEVFGPVSRRDYLDSVRADVQGAAQDILHDGVYITLNLCRALALLREDRCLSKAEGAAWGLAHLPEAFHPLIEAAARAYASDQPMQLDIPLARTFADYMLAQITKEECLNEPVDHRGLGL